MKGCIHRAIGQRTWENSSGTHTSEYCSRCGATRICTRTNDGFQLGGYWAELDGVKLEGQHEQGTPD